MWIQTGMSWLSKLRSGNIFSWKTGGPKYVLVNMYNPTRKYNYVNLSNGVLYSTNSDASIRTWVEDQRRGEGDRRSGTSDRRAS